MKRAVHRLMALLLLMMIPWGAQAEMLETDEMIFAQCCDILGWHPAQAWTLEGFRRADFNGDGITDMVAVLRGPDGHARRLMTAISNDGGYVVSEDEHTLPAAKDDEPETQIEIFGSALVLKTAAEGAVPHEDTFVFVPESGGFVPEAEATAAPEGSGGKQAVLTCDACGKQFADEQALSAHVCVSYPQPGQMYCDQCGNWYDEGEAFRAHGCLPPEAMLPSPEPTGMGEKTDGEIACPVCNQAFATDEAYRGHVCVSRPSQGEIFCDVCGQYYQEGEEFRNHTCQ